MNDQPEQLICRLCQQPRTLCDSHFMPAAFYRHLGLGETGKFQNKALLRLTKEKLARVPKQVTKYLLCRDCEGRFSEGGERWVSQFGYQVGRSFLLQDAILRAAPHFVLGNGWVYHMDDAPEIDWNKLAYFALSVFWRGAADPWTPENGAKPFIEMAPALQENLRRFLLRETDYPEDILLMLKLASGRTREAHMMSFPSKGNSPRPRNDSAAVQFFHPRDDLHPGARARNSRRIHRTRLPHSRHGPPGPRDELATACSFART